MSNPSALRAYRRARVAVVPLGSLFVLAAPVFVGSQDTPRSRAGMPRPRMHFDVCQCATGQRVCAASASPMRTASHWPGACAFNAHSSRASFYAGHACARRWRATCVPSARRGRLRTHACNRGLCRCTLCVVACVRALQSGKRLSAHSGRPAGAQQSLPERRC